MTDLPPYPDSTDESSVATGRGPTPSKPRWVAVLGLIIAIGLVLLFVVLHLTGSIGTGAH
jgi:hypothetical protein